MIFDRDHAQTVLQRRLFKVNVDLARGLGRNAQNDKRADKYRGQKLPATSHKANSFFSMPELVARSENSVPMLTHWPARRASDRGLTEQETPPQHLAKRDIFGILKVWRRRGSWRLPTDEVFQSVNGLYALTPNTVKFLRKRSSKCPANFYFVAGFLHCLFGQPRQTKVCRTSVPANRPWVMTIQNPQQVLAGR